MALKKKSLTRQSNKVLWAGKKQILTFQFRTLWRQSSCFCQERLASTSLLWIAHHPTPAPAFFFFFLMVYFTVSDGDLLSSLQAELPCMLLFLGKKLWTFHSWKHCGILMSVDTVFNLLSVSLIGTCSPRGRPGLCKVTSWGAMLTWKLRECQIGKLEKDFS